MVEDTSKNIAEDLRKSIMRFRRDYTNRSDYFEKLTFSEMTVFWVMRGIMCENPGLEQVALSDIGRMLKISKPAITQNINRLEDKELIERVTLRSDRRATYVKFTQKGKEIFEHEKKFIDEIMIKIVDRMGEENVRRFIELLDAFREISEQIILEYNEKEKR